MANNPLNLALRFVLELVALSGLALLGWTLVGTGLQLVAAIVLPVLAAAAWGTFRVPNDPGAAPVAVPGPVRLGLEVAVFAGGVAGFAVAGRVAGATVFAALTVGHYLASYDRVLRLLRNDPPVAQS
jgi:Protein of unknown function (DUF2568)